MPGAANGRQQHADGSCRGCRGQMKGLAFRSGSCGEKATASGAALHSPAAKCPTSLSKAALHSQVDNRGSYAAVELKQ